MAGPRIEAASAIRDRAELPAVFARRSLIFLAALLLGETTINYIDRQVVSVLAPALRDEFRLSNSQYAAIVNAFLITYAFAYSLAGWVLDRLGVVRGLTLSVVWWSAAGMLTSLARGPFGLGFFRSLLAIGEAGAWPAFAKAAAMWAPKEARTLVIGICNSGSSLGSVIAPPLVAWITLGWGWRAAFLVTGALGFLWVAAFQIFHRLHPQMVDSEHSSGGSGARVTWISLLGYRQTWTVFFCRFLADPMWYFYVFWIPEFLARERGLNLAAIGAVAWIPFLVADIANFASGYAALKLERAGWSVNKTRKAMMLAATIVSPVGILAVLSHSLFWTLALISVSIFFWIFWSVAVHSLAGDYFPPAAVASVYGIAGSGSTIGSAISTWGVGFVLDVTHSYTPVFFGIGLLMPVALLVGMLLMGSVEPVTAGVYLPTKERRP
jgi:ACS family hexuronate transporter-like MFS transporter